MLPGFRFLFVTTILSVSVLVFALGAAALLRATHDSFATFPQRRAPQEQVFVKQQFDTSRPVIALLRTEPEPSRTDRAPPALAAPAMRDDPSPVADGKSESAASASETPAPSQTAALSIPEASMPAPLDTNALRGEILATVDTKPAEVAATPVTEASPAASEPDATSGVAATQSPTRIAALSEGDDVIKLVAEARKKAEAAQLKARNLEAARRARAAKIAAQRRRIAAIRARTVQQKPQTQQPFNSSFGTN